MMEAMESSMNAGVDRSGVGFTPMHHHNHHSSCGESSEEELSVLPRHTKVVVTGNNRTKSVLVGLEGVVKKAVGLGGWHWLVLTNGIEVKLQRNALSVLEPPTGNEDDDEFEFEIDEDINDQEPNTSSNEDEDMEEGLVHKDPSIYGKLLEKLEHSHKETYKRRKLEARKSQNTEEDSSNYKQEAFHLLNKCDTLDGIIGKSGRSNALQTEDSENKDKDETFQASLSDEGDESDAASDDPDKGCSTVGTIEANRGGGGYK